MRGKRLRVLGVAALLGIVLVLSAAGVSAAERWSQPGPSGMGGGGFMAGAWQPDLGALNEDLQAAGFSPLPSTVVFMGGGGGGGMRPGFSMGGFGGAGSAISEAAANGRRARLTLAYGGFTIEYGARTGRFGFFGGSLIGGGGAELLLSYGTPASFTEAVDKPFNTVLETDFVVVGPYGGLEVQLTDFMGLRLVGQYVYGYSASGWKHEGTNLSGGRAATFAGPAVYLNLLWGAF